MKHYLPALVVLLIVLSFSVTALQAVRTISGTAVTVTIEPGEELELTLTETLAGGATVVAGSFPRADCGVDAQNVVLTCGGSSAETITFTYRIAGAGTVAGTVDGVDYVEFTPETVAVTGNSAIGAPAPAGPAVPPPPPPPGAPGEDEEEEAPPAPAPPGAPEEEAGDEEEPEISRAPLTDADLADDADADGDGEVNSADADDDGDNVVDADDQCTNTFVGAERVANNGCLEGDLGAQPDGCVNNDDVSAANFLDILLTDGFDGLSSLLWGMFDNWNADEGTC